MILAIVDMVSVHSVKHRVGLIEIELLTLEISFHKFLCHISMESRS